MTFMKYVPIPFTESASLWMSVEFSCYILPAALILDFGPTCAVGLVVGPFSCGLRWASAALLEQYQQMEVLFGAHAHKDTIDAALGTEAIVHGPGCCGVSAE